MKLEIEQEKEKIEKEKQEVINLNNSIFEMLSNIIDISEVKASCRVMASSINGVGNIYRLKFDEAQGVVIKARNNLKNAGLACEAIEFLATANFNRPDRDHPDNMSKSAWINVFKIET